MTGPDGGRVFATDRREGVLRLHRPETRWLSTGYDGGHSQGPVAYSVTVPEGWEPDDVGADVRERRERVGFAEAGPTLVTGVAARHARGARCGPVEACATVGLSNPAALPQDPPGGALPEEPPRVGTVNLVVGTHRALDDAALANLVSVAAEAKAATLLDAAGFPGTTSDAVVVACDPAGERAQFSGSATPVGAAARACVREAVRAALSARYDDSDDAVPASVAEATHGVSTDVRATTFEP